MTKNGHLQETGPIGVFDSGYGGLTILDKIRSLMPEYDYLYLGDNARTPYGTRSFEVVYDFTLQAVEKLFELGCPLVILACNTASAKALRSIQQVNLPQMDDTRRVLGVIRPTAECIGDITQSRHVGILATSGTIKSESYLMEIHKLFPDIIVTGEACPMWVPLIESGEHLGDGANYFVEKYLTELLTRDPLIDTIILGCTHYPLLQPKIEKFLSSIAHSQSPIANNPISLISQGKIVAHSLEDYLHRHPNIAERALSPIVHCPSPIANIQSPIAHIRFLTTESATKFSESASLFLSEPITAHHIEL